MEDFMAKIDANDCGSTSILQHTAKTYDKTCGGCGYSPPPGSPAVG